MGANEQESVLDKFLRDENLKLYRRLLSETTDEDRRRVLKQLIAQLTQHHAHQGHGGS
jgi:rubrerythrin